MFEAGGYAYGALVLDDMVLGLHSGDPGWVDPDGCRADDARLALVRGPVRAPRSSSRSVVNLYSRRIRARR